MVAYGIKLSVEARFNGDVTLDANTSEFAPVSYTHLTLTTKRIV